MSCPGTGGFPRPILLSELDQMEEGDVFLLHVLDETLAYEVDQIRSCCLMKWRPCHFTGRRPVHTGHLHAIRSEYPPAARPGAPGGIYRKDHGIRTGGRGADRSVDRRVGTGSSGICYPAGGSAYRTAVEKETEKERKVVHEL